jgi:site-specific recombinase XerD
MIRVVMRPATICVITLLPRLAQQGVPLNTVRDLLGHGSVGMSLRYAHLAPDQRREAVAKLN